MFLQRDFDGIIEFLVGSARTVGTAFQLARGECVPIGPWGVRSSWPVGAGLQPAQIRAPLATGMFLFNAPDPAGCKPAATGLA
jgi:hypothetical protein